MKNYRVQALPYEYEFSLENTALVIIDMQRDFCEHGGFGEKLGNDITPAKRIIPVVKRMLDEARRAGMLVIHTREGHRPDLSDCPPAKLNRGRKQGAGIGDMGPMGRILVRGEYGHGIVDELTPFKGEIVIDKPGKGAFYATDLELILRTRRIEKLLVCGVTTHVCVSTTIREANDRGFDCMLLTNCSAAFDPADHEATVKSIHQQGGIFGWVSDSDQVITALEEG